VFPDPGMTVAARDRLVHHSTIFERNRERYRRKKAASDSPCQALTPRSAYVQLKLNFGNAA
jgi:hypothetical protein